MKGFYEVSRVFDEAAERERCYAHWSGNVQRQVLASQAQTSPSTESTEANADCPAAEPDRVARFMNVGVRAEQATFRKAVFEAYEGRCAISGRHSRGARSGELARSRVATGAQGWRRCLAEKGLTCAVRPRVARIPGRRNLFRSSRRTSLRALIRSRGRIDIGVVGDMTGHSSRTFPAAR